MRAELSWAQYANSLFRCRGRWGRRDHAFDKSSIQINYPILVSRWLQFVSVIVCACLYNKRATASMRQGISGFKGVRKVSEKSWGTNGLTPTPPPVGCCLNPGVFWELSPSVGSQRQFFQARSHQFLSEGSPSNVLPFCCAVTCVISQFIALWAGSFYHERFLSASFTLPPRLPRSHSLSSLCSALFAAAQVLWQDHSIDTMWSQFTRLIIPPLPIYNVLKPISVSSLNSALSLTDFSWSV